MLAEPSLALRQTPETPLVEYAWIDGELILLEAARFPVLDRGLLYGEGVFDTMRAYNGRVFRLHEHVQRLLDGAAVLQLGCRFAPPELVTMIQNVLNANRLTEAYVRLTMTRGDGGFGMEPSEGTVPRLVAVARPLPEWSPTIYSEGIRAITTSIRRNETSPLSRIKSLNFLDNLLARKEAKEQGVEEALFLNSQGNLAEAASSNIFLVLGSVLVTPDVASGVLPGITRAVVCELAGYEGLTCEERPVPLSDIQIASEAFLTNSVREIVPLVCVDGVTVGAGKPGRITERILHAYRDLVQYETGTTSQTAGA